MSTPFIHMPHPRIHARTASGPPQTADQLKQGGPVTRFNAAVADKVTQGVGTMWCAYAFALLALVALPSALASGDMLPIIQWVSQTFIQLVMLSVIMVGQNILSRASDKRADETYQDADATLHEALQIQEHLKAQDDAIGTLLDKIAKLEAARAQV